MTHTQPKARRHNPSTMLLAALAAMLMTASCITPAKVNYLQDMYQGSQIELENAFEAVVSPYDELNINVSCADPDMAKPFNINQNISNLNYGQHNGYLVDVYGNIIFPVLGQIHVAGLTRLQLQDTLAHMLESGGYLRNPYVMVRFANFKIFFLGADGGKAINISNERCTFLEALAMSGDLSLFTNRSKIAVLREVDGKMTMRYLDPRSSKVFNDPYFMLQQNDFIITPSVNNQTVRSEVSYWLGWGSMIASLASLATSLLLFNNLNH